VIPEPARDGPACSTDAPARGDAKAARGPACPAAGRMAVLVNGAARSNSALERKAEVEAAFGRRGLDPLVEVVPAARLRRTVRRLLREGTRTFVAAGGDGTVATLADALVGTEGTLGIVPLGTFNHFARDAGIPLDLDAAVEVVCRGETALVDAAAVNGRVFVNNASLGVYPDQVRLRDRLRRKAGKAVAAAIGALAALRRFRAHRMLVEIGEERLPSRSPMVIVGNGDYGLEDGKPIERPRLDSGVLALYVFGSEGRVGLVFSVLTGLAGHIDKVPRFEARRARELTIHVGRRRVRVALDGEVVSLRTPLRFRSLPGALRILGPGRRS
jgi:diacylglycerol kinase family enzyme